MSNKISDFLKKYTLFVYLLPVFFVFHGCIENYKLVPVKDALLLTAVYTGASLILILTAYFFYRNTYKAAIITFALMAFHFFFGSLHDELKKSFPGSFITRYTFLLPAAFIFFVVLAWYLKKRKKTFYIFCQYLNFLILALLLIETGLLVSKTFTIKEEQIVVDKELTPCPDCSKPDIYLVLADGYGGRQQLSDLFQFDNSAFENELKNRGFHITDSSTGNYNFTPFTMAAMLNLNYPEGIEGSNTSKNDMRICYNAINNNKTLQYLTGEGYKFYNYSIFDFDGQPSVAKPTFLQTKTKPIASQTFLYRVQRDLWYHLVTDLNLKSAHKGLLYRDLKNNNKIYNLTTKAVEKKIPQPKFIYSHFVFPHYPYYFDSSGKEMPFETLGTDNATNKESYISYLKYCNKKILELTDFLISNSTQPPVIMLVSDHGFREFKDSVDKRYHFMNLNAVLLPDRNYSGFYNGMSTVNLFRVLLNNRFKQKLPLIKDSTSFLKE